MSIHTEELREVSGFDKEIETSALGMIFDNLQVYQYQYPERSTVRELVSNALDSTKERQNAQAILSGAAKEEDYYLRREDAVYRDSNFDASYYDLQYLSNENKVYVDYYEGAESERDRIEIIDYGVGLGKDRLKGYFKLGYSTKRNARFALGKFGIGAKAALSTGVDCYYVESRYNGLLTKWNVYSAKINSLVPKFNLQTGQENVLLPFGNTEIYAEDQRFTQRTSNCYNYTKIVIAVKKHKKQAYLDAVKSQLMYFENVQLTLHQADGTEQIIPIKAQIVYEDEYLVVARNTIYNKPHIILNGVNYGLIDFRELELEDKHGNVGIKVPAEGVVVNPSRESVIWNDKTRETILKSFELAVGAASNLVADRLSTTDYWAWHRTLEQAKGRLYNSENEGDALGVLSRIIDVEKIDFSFKPDPRLGSGGRALWGISYLSYNLHSETEKKGKKTVRKTKLVRTEKEYIWSLNPDVAIVLMEGNDLKPYIRTIRYLLSLPDYKEVLVFRKKEYDYSNFREASKYLPEDTDLYSLRLYSSPSYFLDDALKDKNLKRFLKKGQELLDLADIQHSVFKHIEASTRTKILEQIPVPEDFKFNPNVTEEEEVIEEEVEAPTRVTLTPEQLRRQEGRVFLRTPRFNNGLELHGVEPNLLEMDGWTNTYYCTQENQTQLLVAAALSITAANNHIKTAPPFEISPTEKRMVYYDRSGVATVDYPGRPDRKNLKIDGWEDMTSTERDRIQKEVDQLMKSFHSVTPYYFTPSMDGSHTIESYKQPAVRFVIVSRDLERKLPDNVRPIQEFYLTFTSNQEITMSNILSNWYLATLVRDTVHSCSNFASSHFFDNSRIKGIYHELSTFVQKWGKADLFHLLKDTDRESLGAVTEFLEKVLKFQQFVTLHRAEPELIAAQAKHLFGNPAIKGATAFDLEIYNKIAELKEYYDQAGYFLQAFNWHNMDQRVADTIREISLYKGWEPWNFEPPYPLPTEESMEEQADQAA